MADFSRSSSDEDDYTETMYALVIDYTDEPHVCNSQAESGTRREIVF
jgi:hypothetical protein